MKRLVGVLLLAFAAPGCTVAAGLAPAPTPQPCEEIYSARRCLAMADAATELTPQTRDDVARILIVPSPPPDDGILQSVGGATPITVRLLMRDGATLESQMCGGIGRGPACSDEPPAWETEGDLIGGGYHDVPCAGEPPDGCASPIPAIDRAIATGAEPIDVPSRSIAIDRAGGYEVVLGTGSLPNGVLSQATYRLPDPWPVDVTFTGNQPRLEIRSLEPDGKSFGNAYTHGWREGLERIEAIVVFDVKRFDPGASIEIIDVVVR